jgi:DNA-binding CsgD family transcriptional regulator
MEIPDGKISAVQAFINRLFTMESESEVLKFICPALADIVPTDFYGFYLFPNILSKQPIFYTNNSEEFIDAYNAGLGEYDLFTERMINTGNLPAVYHNIVTPELYKKSFFLNETDKVRGTAAKDGCYMPLVIDKTLAGFIALGRMADYPEPYSREELRLLAFLNSFIPAGIERALGGPPPAPDAALVNGYGEVVAAGDAMARLLREVFGGKHYNTPCRAGGENGTKFKSMVDNMFLGERYIGKGEVDLARKGKKWTLRFSHLPKAEISFREYFPEKPQLMVSIKADGFSRGFLALESALERFCVSPREREVIFLVFKGFSNADIAAELQIAEATVKHHLYNIYNKTGVDSRTHLIFRLLGG